MRWSRLLLAVAIMVSSLSLVLADVPGMMSYQGVLKDSEGQPVADDVYAIKFTIYNAETEGVVLWESNGFIPIQTADGLFTHILGSTNPLPDSLSRYSDLWVGITVDLDEELSPRTRLVSVPFSLNAQYSDTTGTSLDKTIDASELIQGTLNTERFSAYEDLTSEDKIGNAPDQVAAGVHFHSGASFPGTMVRYEDTTTIVVDLDPQSGFVVKSLIVAPGEIGNFFRISFVVKFTFATSFWSQLTVRANDIELTEWESSVGSNSWMVMSQIECQKLTENQWYSKGNSIAVGAQSQNEQLRTVNMELSSGLLIEIRIEFNQYPVTVTVGHLIVEYDVD